MTVLNSRQNPGFKELLKLKQRKFRLDQNLFLAEGERLVQDGLAAGWQPRQIIISEGRNYPGPVTIVTNQLMAVLSETQTPQGLIAVFERPRHALADLAGIEDGLVLVLDGLQDPGNAGSLLRSAAAAGIAGVIALTDTVELTNPKVVRASMGGVFRIPWVENVEMADFISWFQANKLALLRLEPRNGVPYHQYDYSQSGIGLVVGSEANGVSAKLSSLCTDALTIPMPGGSESLNAAMAATLVLWQALIGRGL